MTDDAGELEHIVVEAVSDDDELDQEEIDVEVERILIRGEARVMSLASLLFMAVGTVFAVGWFFVAWRTQSELTGGGRASSTGFDSGDPDLVDRIYAFEQIGVLLLFSLLLVATGCGLRLYSTRINADRVD